MSASPMPVLSVVIPAYNSAPWIPSTVAALSEAVHRAGLDVELIVVDDGSTDDTAGAARSATATFPGRSEVITQPNAGRFAARRRGLESARAEMVLLLDSRVLIGPDSLRDVWPQVVNDDLRVWNGHIVTDPSTPLVGLFWEVPTHLFWSHYLADPRPMVLTPENFDRAPKGTTMFLAPRTVLEEAFRFAAPTVESPLVSDDTKVLRWIAGHGGIRLDPVFRATYRPRTTVRGFLAHSFDRGTLFVDSYAGTTPLRSVVLLLLAVAPVALGAIFLSAVLGGRARRLLPIGGLLAAAVAAVSGTAASRRCPPRSIRAFLTYLLPFAAPFWAGIVRGIGIHRAAFLSRAPKEHTP
ncbi:glycosyltransferase family 2 protein [Microbacterium sp. SLBN-111]|uniref:glycosyltransferase family 2 protein n=1 Tax=Microbacterium sp. SLBN-111 TaxID=3377733 RepID=UPI003C769C12